MWVEGMIEVNGKEYSYWAKVYDEPSEYYGINGGKVSKLTIRADGKEVVNYDRGWDIRPKAKDDKTAMQTILKKYN